MLATLDQLLAKEPFSKANALEGLKLLTSISDSDLLSLQPLLKVNGGRWDLSSDRGLGMRRIFKFKGFKDAWVSSLPLLVGSEKCPFKYGSEKYIEGCWLGWLRLSLGRGLR